MYFSLPSASVSSELTVVLTASASCSVFVYSLSVVPSSSLDVYVADIVRENSSILSVSCWSYTMDPEVFLNSSAQSFTSFASAFACATSLLACSALAPAESALAAAESAFAPAAPASFLAASACTVAWEAFLSDPLAASTPSPTEALSAASLRACVPVSVPESVPST